MGKNTSFSEPDIALSIAEWPIQAKDLSAMYNIAVNISLR